MKTIAILCDGTWQALGQAHPTNVAKLARAIGPRSANGGAQVVYYDDGVGVGQGVADDVVRLVGGITGEGLDYKITRAYEFLCLNYEPADRIHIFGFSRGAYTARSLAGLLRWLWILKRDQANDVDQVAKLYRSRPPKGSPQSAEDDFQARAAAFRAQYCYPADAFVDDKTYVPGDPGSLAADETCAWVQYVGVWDTVDALGLPSAIPFSEEWNARYRFHDASLSRFVRSARHAMAIDERRAVFAPTPWDNIDAQNAHAGAAGLDAAHRPYQQLWFPGHHGGVGGGGTDGDLALIALLWIAEGAARAGLVFDRAQLAGCEARADPAAAFDLPGGAVEVVEEVLGTADRAGPAALEDVSLSARLRWARMPAYRPAPLRRVPAVVRGLDDWAAPADPQAYYRP